jgi:hypothetical protein
VNHMPTPPLATVRALWAAMHARDWRDTLPGRTLFDPRDDVRAHAP